MQAVIANSGAVTLAKDLIAWVFCEGRVAWCCLTLDNCDTEDPVSFEFEDIDGGGTEGTAQRVAAVGFLEDQGCN